VSCWCARDFSILEEGATLVYDPFHATGVVMASLIDFDRVTEASIYIASLKFGPFHYRKKGFDEP
jgi:hypothetical protein